MYAITLSYNNNLFEDKALLFSLRDCIVFSINKDMLYIGPDHMDHCKIMQGNKLLAT